MNAWLAGALVLGAAGSAHCVGMCGPLALAVPRYGAGRAALWGSTVLLNSGRLFTYVLLGTAFGAFGQAARLAGVGRAVSIGAGVVLLLSVLVPGLLERWLPQGRIAVQVSRWRGRLARQFTRTAPEAIFFTGVLNGWLPCGLVYSAAMAATTQGSVGQGALFMAAFGLGTWPALFALRLSGGLLGQRLRSRLRAAAPALVMTMAVLLIVRGLELGIPYVSPAPLTAGAHAVTCH